MNLILNIGKLVLEIVKCCGVRKGVPVGISFVVVRSMRPLSSVPCPPRYFLLHNPVSFFPTTCRSGDPLWFLPVVAFSAIGLYELSILYLSSPSVPMPITGGSPLCTGVDFIGVPLLAPSIHYINHSRHVLGQGVESASNSSDNWIVRRWEKLLSLLGGIVRWVSRRVIRVLLHRRIVRIHWYLWVMLWGPLISEVGSLRGYICWVGTVGVPEMLRQLVPRIAWVRGYLVKGLLWLAGLCVVLSPRRPQLEVYPHILVFR